MSTCTDNPRLGLIGCGQTYSGKMAHSVARVEWSTHPDGRAHATFPSTAMADKCWRGDRMFHPATLAHGKNEATFRQDARGIWRGATPRPVPMTPLLMVAAVLGVLPPSPTAPAQRLNIATLEANQDAPAVPGDCDSYKPLALTAGWSEAQWPTLRHIMHRESRCYPDVINRYHCVGLLQACRINHKRLGVSATDLKDPFVNLTVGRQLCQEWIDVGRSCWRPWWTRGFRP